MSTNPESQSAPVRLLSARFHRVSRRGGVRFREGPLPAPRKESRRPADIARLLALAHHIEATIARGQVRDATSVSLQLGLCPARVTQVLGLTLLAPDIQEAVLFLEAVDGVEPLSEARLRAVASSRDWGEQRRRWLEVSASF